MLIECITATKQILDSISENNLFWKTDCPGYYSKIKGVLSKFVTKPKPICPNITKEERKSVWDLQKDANCIIYTADKGVVLVIIDKDMYIDKCRALLDDEMSTRKADTKPSQSIQR